MCPVSAVSRSYAATLLVSRRMRKKKKNLVAYWLGRTNTRDIQECCVHYAVPLICYAQALALHLGFCIFGVYF